ncbi:BTB/POZ domain-containing protein 19 isoform X1 [Hydra vulgaris]|uniref:BTB/POZ domain-containing protein 19 n=1 Tax=Hydra vulgaris TaxID=6087 RepID=T2MJX3_HYDVU|nr:BTB/POZ domain-containing protein 19 [Hydra vulgaris]
MSQFNEYLTLEAEASSLLNDMKSLLNNKLYSDVKFAIGNEKVLFHAHRCILALRCQIFADMFKEMPITDEPFLFPDLQSDAFMLVLEFIYTNKCNVLKSDVIFVLSTALEFGVMELVKVCEKYFEENVTLETACQAMQAAVTFGLDSFKRSLLPFFRQNTAEIFNTSSFNELSEETLAYILQDDELNMDEYDIIKAVENWTLVNSVALDKPASEVSRSVVCNVRLPLLSSDELAEIECLNVKNHFIPIEQISLAWKHIALKTPLNASFETTPRTGTRIR